MERKKRIELLQVRILKPKMVIFDEIDSGLDIDAIRIIAEGINDLMADNPNMTVVVVTHYRRIVDNLKNPNKLFIMDKGRVVQQGEVSILDRLEAEGYKWINQA